MREPPATPRIVTAAASLGACLKVRRKALTAVLLAVIFAAGIIGCHDDQKMAAPLAPKLNVQPFNFQISSGGDDYQIEGAIAGPPGQSRRPALLVLNGDRGNARECVTRNGSLVAMGLDVACISLPGGTPRPGSADRAT
jgi:hypothetical protein